jgi:chloride channel protein, CIC family
VRRPNLEPETQFLLLAAAVGAAGALGNQAFRSAIALSHRLFVGSTSDLLEPIHAGWAPSLLILLAPVLGGLAVGLLSRLSRQETGGYAMPAFLEAVNLKNAQISIRSTLLRTLAAVITLGSGGSAGVEGPVASLGGGIGAAIARGRRIVGERLRVMVACGASAAIASAYGAPIAGVFFTQEIVLAGNYELQNFVRVVVASGTATVLSRAMRGDEPLFSGASFQLASGTEILFYLVLGLFCGVLGAFFARIFWWFQRRFAESGVRPHLRPALGGLIVGLIALVSRDVLGDGAETIERMVELTVSPVGLPLLSMVVLLVGKVVATSATIGSGGGGGVFGPSLFLGAVLGAAIGALANQFAPGHAGMPGHYAVVGMGALLAATARAPLTSIFLVFEMTGSSSTAVLPTLVAVAAAIYVARLIEPHSIDEMALARRGIRLQGGRESSTLASLTVGEAMRSDVETVRADLPAPMLQSLMSHSRNNAFIVVDGGERMVGILSIQDLRMLDQRTAEALGPLTIAADLCEREVSTAFPDETLASALARMDLHGFRQLPVVSRDDTRRVVGMLERRHILAAYQRALRPQPAPEESTAGS